MALTEMPDRVGSLEAVIADIQRRLGILEANLLPPVLTGAGAPPPIIEAVNPFAPPPVAPPKKGP